MGRKYCDEFIAVHDGELFRKWERGNLVGIWEFPANSHLGISSRVSNPGCPLSSIYWIKVGSKDVQCGEPEGTTLFSRTVKSGERLKLKQKFE